MEIGRIMSPEVGTSSEIVGISNPKLGGILWSDSGPRSVIDWILCSRISCILCSGIGWNLSLGIGGILWTNLGASLGVWWDFKS